MKNVLVFSCGAIPAIDINIALRGSTEYRIFGASSYDDHGVYIYDNYIGNVPFIYEEDFIPRFNKILEHYNIDFIIPLHETMILFFQEHIAEINATVISSCYETALLCRYKSKTYEALKNYSFVPKTYKIYEVKQLPVFIKKDDDQGARNSYKVDTWEQLELYGSMKDMVICEYLPGHEVTVDCFTDRHGKLRMCNPRAADRMLAGIDVHARRLANDSEIESIAKQINASISFRGPWFFQVKQDRNGVYKLLEIATRFAGAFGLTRCMDINTPLMAIRDFDEKDLYFGYNDLPIEADKMFIGRYKTPVDYDRVIIDNIETFSYGGRIDTFFMMFLYQCVNKGKSLVLLTDNTDKSLESLDIMKIRHELFNEYLDSAKLDEISFDKAVFLSRNEERRRYVREQHGVICYDPTAIEVLMDWRG